MPTSRFCAVVFSFSCHNFVNITGNEEEAKFKVWPGFIEKVLKGQHQSQQS